MYRREKSKKLKSNESAFSNNLSVRIDMARSTIHYAVVHRYTVNLVSASMNGQTVNSRQVVCKEPSVNYCSSIIQVNLFSIRIALRISANKLMYCAQCLVLK